MRIAVLPSRWPSRWCSALRRYHASGVVSPGRGVVAFCGLSHTGKSTLAYGLSLRGYPIWADDILAFDASDGDAVCSMRVPFRVNLRSDSAAHFAAAGDAASSAEEEDGCVEARTAGIDLHAVRVDAVPPSAGSIRRLEPDAAFMALLEHAFFFQPQTTEERRRMLRDYLEVIGARSGLLSRGRTEPRDARRDPRRGRGDDRSEHLTARVLPG